MIDLLDVQILAVVSLVFLAFVAGHLLRSYDIHWFPESAAAVVLGSIYAVIWFFIPNFNNQDADFNPDSFFLVLLPIIIFESGYSVHKARLFANIGAILTFAVIGTMISAVVMAAISFGLSRLNTDLAQFGLIDYLIFGAIMSATDPVATLAIFGKVNAEPNLFSLVFGESVLNDAVAITFFKTLLGFKESLAHHGEFTAGMFFESVGTFVLLGLGSTLLGVVLGALNALILRRTLIKHHPPMEILFIITFAYSSYVLSDAIGLSGIVAIFFFGIATRHYTYYNLSDTSKAGSMWLFTAFKELAETTVFCFLGLSILQEQKAYNAAFIAIAIFACLLSRLFMITPLSMLLNIKRSAETKITYKMQLVMWNAGLRGAVAYALSLRLPEGPGRSLFVTTIHAVVIFTIFVHGIMTGPFLRWTGLSAQNAGTNAYQHVGASHPAKPKKKKLHGFWSSLDKKYLIPFLSYPRDVYKQEQEQHEQNHASELAETSDAFIHDTDDDELVHNGVGGDLEQQRGSAPASMTTAEDWMPPTRVGGANAGGSADSGAQIVDLLSIDDTNDGRM